jgi:uncharacterized membrane protein YdjX (TVP38/TMEM64 family)
VGGEALAAVMHAVDSLRGQPWAWPVFVAAFAVSCQGLPTMIFPVIGGILFGFYGGVLANVAGFVAGSTLTFLISRRWGTRLWEKWRAQPLPPVFQKPNFWLLLVVRLTGFPPLMLANILAGLSEMRLGVFVLATALGVTPWSAMMSFLSEILWQALRSGGMVEFKNTFISFAEPLAVVLGSFGVLVGLAAWFGRRLLPPAVQEGGSVKE